jgi:hypothetical protein
LEVSLTPTSKRKKAKPQLGDASPDKKMRPQGRKASDKKGKSATAKTAKSKDTSNVDSVDLITRRVTRQCSSLGVATKIFAALRRSIGQAVGTSRMVTQEDVDEAWKRCQEFFQENAVEDDEQTVSPSSDESAESSDSDSSPGDSSSSQRKQARANRHLKRDEMILESLMAESEEELSGEEEVDEDPEELEEVPCEEWPPLDAIIEVDDGYPAHAWSEHMPDQLPGCTGFNARCTTVMRQQGIAATLHTDVQPTEICPPLQPHQESVAFLLHPKSPVTRLLVDHPTGSGKTWEMIRVLDNYFHDPRPKVPIFPKSPVCRNFYAELLRWPNKYRDYFCCVRPAEAAIASGTCDWRDVRMAKWELTHFPEEEMRLLCFAIREVLEMKNMFYMGRLRQGLREQFSEKHPGEHMPSGPMRALSYTSAGGGYIGMREQGDVPKSAMMKIGYTRGCGNVYTNKVVIMDEVHNLVRTQTKYGEQLQCLRDLLVAAKNLVLAGFTGTPILNQPAEGRQLLDIIKGIEAPEGDEGFLSSFPVRPQKLFPVSLPRGIPDAILTQQLQRQLVVPVELSGDILRVYDKKRRMGLSNRMLSSYCNISSYFGCFHEGKFGAKLKILRNPTECCPKLHAIAMEVAANPLKAVIMTSRQCGYSVILELVRRVASQSEPPFGVATMDELSEYNHVSNIRGEKYRVLVADASQCSEGVSFLAVRRTFLSDVPSSPSQFIQQCGRAIRMFGHQGLPEEEQEVIQHLYVAKFSGWMRSPLAMWVFRMFRHVKDGENELYAKRMLAKLHHVGVKSLAELKAQIDAHGDLKLKTLRRQPDSVSRKDVLNQTDVVMFLELAGLWQEAQPQSTIKSTSSGKAKKIPTPQFAGQSARFAAFMAGSSRLKALTSHLRGVSGPSAAASGTRSGKSTLNSQLMRAANQLKLVVRSAGRNLEDANAAFEALSKAVSVVRRVCEQIDSFAPTEAWQTVLGVELGEVQSNECVAAALRAASPTFKFDERDLTELTVAEIKKLLTHLKKAEHAVSLTSALLTVKALVTNIDSKAEEDRENEVEESIGKLLQRDCALSALREVAPDVYLARGSGGLKQLTVDQLKSLRDVLEREKNSDSMACAWSPYVLVRALLELYRADSVEDAVLTLDTQSADEIALNLLAARTREFAPALAALREKAIDRDLFHQFVEPAPSGEDDDALSEAALQEVDMMEPCNDNELQPVELPEGWKLEWVSQIRGKTREQFRFVDPVGRKYYSVQELRIAIVGGIEAVQKARLARQEARALGVADKVPVSHKAPSRPSGSSGPRKKSRW